MSIRSESVFSSNKPIKINSINNTLESDTDIENDKSGANFGSLFDLSVKDGIEKEESKKIIEDDKEFFNNSRKSNYSNIEDNILDDIDLKPNIKQTTYENKDAFSSDNKSIKNEKFLYEKNREDSSFVVEKKSKLATKESIVIEESKQSDRSLNKTLEPQESSKKIIGKKKSDPYATKPSSEDNISDSNLQNDSNIKEAQFKVDISNNKLDNKALQNNDPNVIANNETKADSIIKENKLSSDGLGQTLNNQTFQDVSFRSTLSTYVINGQVAEKILANVSNVAISNNAVSNSAVTLSIANPVTTTLTTAVTTTNTNANTSAIENINANLIQSNSSQQVLPVSDGSMINNIDNDALQEYRNNVDSVDLLDTSKSILNDMNPPLNSIKIEKSLPANFLKGIEVLNNNSNLSNSTNLQNSNESVSYLNNSNMNMASGNASKILESGSIVSNIRAFDSNIGINPDTKGVVETITSFESSKNVLNAYTNFMSNTSSGNVKTSPAISNLDIASEQIPPPAIAINKFSNNILNQNAVNQAMPEALVSNPNNATIANQENIQKISIASAKIMANISSSIPTHIEKIGSNIEASQFENIQTTPEGETLLLPKGFLKPDTLAYNIDGVAISNKAANKAIGEGIATKLAQKIEFNDVLNKDVLPPNLDDNNSIGKVNDYATLSGRNITESILKERLEPFFNAKNIINDMRQSFDTNFDANLDTTLNANINSSVNSKTAVNISNSAGFEDARSLEFLPNANGAQESKPLQNGDDTQKQQMPSSKLASVAINSNEKVLVTDPKLNSMKEKIAIDDNMRNGIISEKSILSEILDQSNLSGEKNNNGNSFGSKDIFNSQLISDITSSKIVSEDDSWSVNLKEATLAKNLDPSNTRRLDIFSEKVRNHFEHAISTLEKRSYSAIRFNDSDIGKVQIDISMDSNKVRVDVYAEQEAARQYFKDSRHLLQNELEKKNYHLSQYDVSDDNQNAFFSKNQQGSTNNDSRQNSFSEELSSEKWNALKTKKTGSNNVSEERLSHHEGTLHTVV